MTELLSESEYEAFREAQVGETVTVETKEGGAYALRVTEWKGATLVGVGVVGGAPSVIELRGGRGRDADAEQPWVALGIGGPESVETTDVETGVTHIEGVGDVAVTQERGTVSYDEEVVVFERRGQEPVTLG